MFLRPGRRLLQTIRVRFFEGKLNTAFGKNPVVFKQSVGKQQTNAIVRLLFPDFLAGEFKSSAEDGVFGVCHQIRLQYIALVPMSEGCKAQRAIVYNPPEQMAIIILFDRDQENIA